MTQAHLKVASFEEACAILGVPVPEIPRGYSGRGFYQHRDEGGDLLGLGVFANLITDIGDQYYGERAAGIGSPPAQVTGMKLGTGSTAVAKTGAGAAIGTYAGAGVTASKAIDGTWPQSSQPGGAGTARQIQWRTSWSAGQATVNGLNEVVISNQTSLADDAGTAANTISRALLSPVVNKGASDTLTITWNHNLLGA